MLKKLFALAILSTCIARVSAQTASLNHIAVYVYDLKSASDFYKNVIHLQEIPEPFHDGKHTWFKVGEHSQLHLISGAKEISEHGIDSHLCFSITEYQAFIDKLHSQNIPFRSWTGEKDKITIRPDGVKQIYLQDPDKYWVEINDDKF